MSKKIIPRLNTDLNIIQALDDLPNQTGGLTADQLKAKFDEAANAIKTYINGSLCTSLQSETAGTSGASGIGIESAGGSFTSNNVMDALIEILAVAQAAQAGTIQAQTITGAAEDNDHPENSKIKNRTIGNEDIANIAISTRNLQDSSVTPQKCSLAFIPSTETQDRTMYIGQFAGGVGNAYKVYVVLNGPIILNSQNYGDSLPGSGTTGQLFFKKVPT